MKYLAIFAIVSIAGASSIVSKEPRGESLKEIIPVEFIDFEDQPIYILVKKH